GLSGLPAERGRDVEDAVVAEPCTWCDTGEAADGGMIRTGGCRRPGVARRDAGDVRAVEGRLRVEREPARLARAGAGERPGGDHLGRRVGLIALREAGRILEARGIEEHVLLVDPVVDDPDLDPVA